MFSWIWPVCAIPLRGPGATGKTRQLRPSPSVSGGRSVLVEVNGCSPEGSRAAADWVWSEGTVRFPRPAESGGSPPLPSGPPLQPASDAPSWLRPPCPPRQPRCPLPPAAGPWGVRLDPPQVSLRREKPEAAPAWSHPPLLSLWEPAPSRSLGSRAFRSSSFRCGLSVCLKLPSFPDARPLSLSASSTPRGLLATSATDALVSLLSEKSRGLVCLLSACPLSLACLSPPLSLHPLRIHSQPAAENSQICWSSGRFHASGPSTFKTFSLTRSHLTPAVARRRSAV